LNEIILNAVLNLFGMQASLLPLRLRGQARATVADYLSKHLRLAEPGNYLALYDETAEIHGGREKEALLAEAGAIAARLKAMLPRFEQHLLLLRYVELATRGGDSVEAAAFARTVATGLGIGTAEVERLRILCSQPIDPARLTPDFLLQDGAGTENESPAACKRLARPDFQGSFVALRLRDVSAHFIVVRDPVPITLDSLPLAPATPHYLHPGSVLRDPRGTRIYAGEIESAFTGGETGQNLVFRGEGLEYRHPGGAIGLHSFSFQENGGRLVGIMGVSGAGKSTLLNVLSGQSRPSAGTLSINGLDLRDEASRLEGVIGFVPQDDLLFEDLTVFENLFYNASLCLANLDAAERARRVEALLGELNQHQARDLKVGTPLDKTISGGQRKRLNIALELIREPSILFVDEPTSGLSSVDSELVMAMLKAQAAKGRLVIVTIHQPSSRVFQMLDALWILDEGGRPIFRGNPLDAIVYFRTAVHQAGMEEYACPQCGGVNPEQILEIVEARSVDEMGRYTKDRRVSPEKWHDHFRAQHPELPAEQDRAPIEARLWRPGRVGQAWVVFIRNLTSHLANRPYLLVTLLEPPLLALVAALLARGAWGGEYVFMENRNLGVYFFMSVIVALFLGLSVSAEEINRDRRILRRERFLHLSWPSYIASKAVYLALVVALQMACFVWIGNPILHVPDMFWTMWLVLFSCAFAASMMSLNISATVASAVTIYILIPMLLVPQMLLGGAVIPFDEIISRESGNLYPPAVADVMPSRWGYEALAVEQYVSNRYTRQFFATDCAVTRCDLLTDAYLPEVRGLADYPFIDTGEPGPAARTAQKLTALGHEIRWLEGQTGFSANLPSPGLLAPARYSRQIQLQVRCFLDRVEQFYRDQRAAAFERKLAAEDSLRRRLGRSGVEALKRSHYNKDIASLALNLRAGEAVRLSGERLLLVGAPICQPPESSWGQAPFMAAHKRLGSWTLPTFTFNLIVLWTMTVVLFGALYGAALPRLADWLGRLAGYRTRPRQAPSKRSGVS